MLCMENNAETMVLYTAAGKCVCRAPNETAFHQPLVRPLNLMTEAFETLNIECFKGLFGFCASADGNLMIAD
jgi:hypothetical protein